jgi:A/G-specific adenine glycosylase
VRTCTIFGQGMARKQPPKPSRVAASLRDWAAANRRALPWRDSNSRYELAVAEILLQQTSAVAVPKVWLALLARYPAPGDLAGAVIDDVERLVRNLGLGSQRAERLLAAAEALHAGTATLPGIGRYGSSVLALAMYERPRSAPVDTNTARIVCRIWALRFERGEPRKKPEVAALVQKIISEGSSPKERLDLLYGLVDLGATICRPSRPRCPLCPLSASCTFARDRSLESRTAATDKASARASGGGTASEISRI